MFLRVFSLVFAYFSTIFYMGLMCFLLFRSAAPLCFVSMCFSTCFNVFFPLVSTCFFYLFQRVFSTCFNVFFPIVSTCFFHLFQRVFSTCFNVFSICFNISFNFFLLFFFDLFQLVFTPISTCCSKHEETSGHYVQTSGG